MPSSLIEPKKSFQTWIWTQAAKSHQSISPAGNVEHSGQAIVLSDSEKSILDSICTFNCDSCHSGSWQINTTCIEIVHKKNIIVILLCCAAKMQHGKMQMMSREKMEKWECEKTNSFID